MKIALLTETFLPSTDGVVTRLCATIDHLIDQGHQIAIVAPHGSPAFYRGMPVLPVKGVHYFFYPQQQFCPPSPKIKAFLDVFGPDVIHVVNPVVLGLGGIYYARRTNLPLVASFHTNLAAYAHRYQVPFLDPVAWNYLRLLHNRAVVNLATSTAMVTELRLRRFHNVRIWAGGVDTEHFHPQHRSESMRSRLTKEDQTQSLLLYVGRLAPEKELHRIRSLLDEFPSLTIAFVGDGPDRSRLERLFAHPRAHFAGFLHGEELSAAYASADGFIFPSTTETLGLVLLEAMASGLPIVAADSKPSRELVAQTGAGLLFDAADEKSLHQTVRMLLLQPDLRAHLAQQARAAAENKNWSDPTQKLINYYELAIRAHRLHHKAAEKRFVRKRNRLRISDRARF
ncbi:MAG: glycosyltransferase family 4 protein [Bacilli bacterium]